MINSEVDTGFAIAIAWPETYCKQAGGWYDSLTKALKISTNNYYKAGHAALVLIDKQTSKAHYFDFGRYHAPYNYGRVRSAFTDPELEITTQVQYKNSTLLNFKEILTELQNKPACHGDGAIHASYSVINFECAYSKALDLQNQSPIPYGPFKFKGSNCSRFVNSCLQAGVLNNIELFALTYKVPLTPTPLNNVNALQNKTVIPKLRVYENFFPHVKRNTVFLQSTLPEVQKPETISKHAQWLSGEGAGSWFEFKINGQEIYCKRYTPTGELEFTQTFYSQLVLPSQNSKDYSIDYMSHFQKLSLRYNKQKFEFEVTQ